MNRNAGREDMVLQLGLFFPDQRPVLYLGYSGVEHPVMLGCHGSIQCVPIWFVRHYAIRRSTHKTALERVRN